MFMNLRSRRCLGITLSVVSVSEREEARLSGQHSIRLREEKEI